jgi:hypothetical protein
MLTPSDVRLLGCAASAVVLAALSGGLILAADWLQQLPGEVITRLAGLVFLVLGSIIVFLGLLGVDGRPRSRRLTGRRPAGADVSRVQRPEIPPVRAGVALPPTAPPPAGGRALLRVPERVPPIPGRWDREQLDRDIEVLRARRRRGGGWPGGGAA